VSAAEWMENRANAASDPYGECSGDCESGQKSSRLEDIDEAIEIAVKRNLYMPLSILAERDELLDWLKENGGCTC
jgi:hypothetical protein